MSGFNPILTLPPALAAPISDPANLVPTVTDVLQNPLVASFDFGPAAAAFFATSLFTLGIYRLTHTWGAKTHIQTGVPKSTKGALVAGAVNLIPATLNALIVGGAFVGASGSDVFIAGLGTIFSAFVVDYYGGKADQRDYCANGFLTRQRQHYQDNVTKNWDALEQITTLAPQEQNAVWQRITRWGTPDRYREDINDLVADYAKPETDLRKAAVYQLMQDVLSWLPTRARPLFIRWIIAELAHEPYEDRGQSLEKALFAAIGLTETRFEGATDAQYLATLKTELCELAIKNSNLSPAAEDEALGQYFTNLELRGLSDVFWVRHGRALLDYVAARDYPNPRLQAKIHAHIANQIEFSRPRPNPETIAELRTAIHAAAAAKVKQG